MFSGASGALLYDLRSHYEWDRMAFGCSVSGVPDADGDGVGDFAVGALQEPSWQDPAPVSAGRAYLLTGSLPPLTVTAVALNAPVSQGRGLYFMVTLTNNTSAPLTGDLRLDVADPGGATSSGLLLDDRTLPADATGWRTFRFRAGGPLGLCTATVSVVEGGATTLGQGTFTFEIVEPEARGGEVAEDYDGVIGPVEVLDGDLGGTP